MKKTAKLFALIGIAALTAMTLSCTKEQDLSGYMTKEEFQQWQNNNQPSTPDPLQVVTVKSFNITIPAINDDFTASTTYSGLQGTLTSNDVLLVYFNTGIGGWILLPFVYGSASYLYANNNGTLTFTKSFVIKSTSEAEQFSVKAYIIPQRIYLEKCNSGVNHSSYEEVNKAYRLDDSNVIAAE